MTNNEMIEYTEWKIDWHFENILKSDIPKIYYERFNGVVNLARELELINMKQYMFLIKSATCALHENNVSRGIR